MANSQLATYTQSDLQEILNLALTKQSANGDLEFSHEQLLEIAAEMSIDPATLQAAEQDWGKLQSINRERGDFDLYRRQKFTNKLARYTIVNGTFVTLNLLVIGGTSVFWSAYILAFWGIGIVWDAWQLSQLKGEEYDLKFQSWKSQRNLRRSISGLLAKVLP
jgi:hypothetical protein